MYFLLKLSMRAVSKLLTFPALAGLRNSTALDADLVSTDLRICWRGHHFFFLPVIFGGRGGYFGCTVNKTVSCIEKEYIVLFPF